MSFSRYASPTIHYVSLAPAKVNLFLHITGKRDDGYHLLESVMVPVSLCDEVTTKRGDEDRLVFTGPFAKDVDSDRLVWSAVAAFFDLASVPRVPIAITIKKNIPVGAGLGGGSSDIASLLMHLNHMVGKPLSIDALARLGGGLGADIPFFIYEDSAFIRGIGDEIQPITLPSYHILLVRPKQGLVTQRVYTHKAIEKVKPLWPDLEHTEEGWDRFCRNASNMLTPNAVELLPEISTVLNVLSTYEGVTLARMSGSGSACFALFEDKKLLDKAKEALSASHTEWWVECCSSASGTV